MRRAAPVVGASLLVLAACGGPSGQDPKAYVHSICTAYAAYEADLTKQGTAFAAAQQAAKDDAARIKAAAGTFLGSQVAATATLQRAVAAQRRPSGHGGDAVRAGFVDATDQAHTTFVTQQQAVASTDATNRIAFFQVLQTAQQQVTAAGQALQTGIENVAAVGDQRINDAISADDVCASL